MPDENGLTAAKKRQRMTQTPAASSEQQPVATAKDLVGTGNGNGEWAGDPQEKMSRRR